MSENKEQILLDLISKVAEETKSEKDQVLDNAISLLEMAYAYKKKGYSVAFTHDGFYVQNTFTYKRIEKRFFKS